MLPARRPSSVTSFTPTSSEAGTASEKSLVLTTRSEVDCEAMIASFPIVNAPAAGARKTFSWVLTMKPGKRPALGFNKRIRRFADLNSRIRCQHYRAFQFRADLCRSLRFHILAFLHAILPGKRRSGGSWSHRKWPRATIGARWPRGSIWDGAHPRSSRAGPIFFFSPDCGWPVPTFSVTARSISEFSSAPMRIDSPDR